MVHERIPKAKCTKSKCSWYMILNQDCLYFCTRLFSSWYTIVHQYLNNLGSRSFRRRIKCVCVVGVDTTYMIMIIFYTIASHDRLQEDLHMHLWSINRMLTRTILVFFILSLWTFCIFRIILYSVNILQFVIF